MKERLDKTVFTEGMKRLFVFFSYDKTHVIAEYYAYLADIPTDIFTKSIGHIIRNEKCIYPNTNIVAVIRGIAPKILFGDTSVPEFSDGLLEKLYDCHKENPEMLVNKKQDSQIDYQ